MTAYGKSDSHWNVRCLAVVVPISGASAHNISPVCWNSATVPNCDFYAVEEDVRNVLNFVFSQPGWTLYELASRHDSALRQFRSTEEVYNAFALPYLDAYFHLHAPEMGGRVYAKRVQFKPNAVPHAKFRHDSHGWGLIQLHLVGPRNGTLKASHTNHNSEARARRWEPTYADEPDRVADWDWQAVTRTSSRLNRYIRTKAPSKLGSRPILSGAFEASLQGTIQLTL
jgi:hypothetical protein